ncbi:MAG TPA: hypothetical protein VNP37_00505, partial [Actinomycetospora sp.]|nr:hypothetical protein [Actinomycetospora sp.]
PLWFPEDQIPQDAIDSSVALAAGLSFRLALEAAGGRPVDVTWAWAGEGALRTALRDAEEARPLWFPEDQIPRTRSTPPSLWRPGSTPPREAELVDRLNGPAPLRSASGR